MEKVYPAGTEIGEWFLAKDGKDLAIRRMLRLPHERKRKSERLPRIKYDFLRHQKDIEDFVIRLNGKDPVMERIREKIDFRHSWISPKLLEDYRINFLRLHMPDAKRAQTHYLYLNKYALNFFIQKMDLKNPIRWFQHQDVWGKYLLNRDNEVLEDEKRIFKPGKIKSAKVIQHTVHELNRFISYLHLKRPNEVPPYKFRPISKAALREHEAVRRLEGRIRTPRYIKPDDYQTIVTHLEKVRAPWRFAVYLAHDFGLRRSECMGLRTTDVRQNHLTIERQYVGLSRTGEAIFRPLKSRKPRHIPYWLGSPKEAYSAIESAPNPNVHPDTLSKLFVDLMHELNLPRYIFHDLSGTFITNCVKKGIAQEDLRLAVGHADTRTTYRYYVMDIRKLDSEAWTPEDQPLSIAR